MKDHAIEAICRTVWPAFALGAILAAPLAHADADDRIEWQGQSSQAPAWEGFYLGFNAGGVWGHDDVSQSTTGGSATGFNPGFDTEGGAVGFQAGYNWMAGPVLVGGGADWDYSGANGGYRVISTLDGESQKFNWLSSVRARIGYPIGNLVPFITGGAAFSDIKNSYVTGAGLSEDRAEIRTGWTIGAGLEYAMPEHFTARLDYRYYDFGSYTDSPGTVFPGYRYRQEPRLNSVTAGISYNFW